LVFVLKNGLDSGGQDCPARNNPGFTGSGQTFPGFAGIFIASPEEFAHRTRRKTKLPNYFRSKPGAKIFSTKGAGAYRFDTPGGTIPLSQSRKQIDLYRWKNFVFRERRKLQFRFEVFNAPNSPTSF
jgi:hypothetical protein